MLTILQRRKFQAWFRMFDTDNSGDITQTDFDAVLLNLAQLYKLTPDMAQYRETETVLRMFWGMIKRLDHDNDNVVHMAEFVIGFQQLIADRAAFEPWVGGLAQSQFQLMDGDGDGIISETDYVNEAMAWHIAEADARLAYSHVCPAPCNGINAEQLAERIGEFFFSSDPDAPGNWLVGPF